MTLLDKGVSLIKMMIGCQYLLQRTFGIWEPRQYLMVAVITLIIAVITLVTYSEPRVWNHWSLLIFHMLKRRMVLRGVDGASMVSPLFIWAVDTGTSVSILGIFFFSFFHSFSHWSKRKMTIVWDTWFLDHLEFLKKWTEIDRYVFSRVERRIKGGASSECWLLYLGHCCFSTEDPYSAGSTPIHSPDSVILIFEWV